MPAAAPQIILDRRAAPIGAGVPQIKRDAALALAKSIRFLLALVFAAALLGLELGRTLGVGFGSPAKPINSGKKIELLDELHKLDYIAAVVADGAHKTFGVAFEFCGLPRRSIRRTNRTRTDLLFFPWLRSDTHLAAIWLQGFRFLSSARAASEIMAGPNQSG